MPSVLYSNCLVVIYQEPDRSGTVQLDNQYMF